MNTGPSVPYRLRPNKAVDRELFLSLLTRLAPKLSVENYHYISLGGAFLEDFRLVHARIGIARMTCVEAEESVHKRQIFNRPIASIECVHSTLEDYLDESDFDTSVIIWFDYTEPRTIASQIERFARTIGTVPIGSVLRVTLNANPESLGKPDPLKTSVEVDGEVSGDPSLAPTVHAWRLERFKERLGALFPSGIESDSMTHKNYGRTLLRVLRLAVEKEELNYPDRKVVWLLATYYKDGQAMVTATLLICAPHDTATEELVKGWEFYSTTDAPHLLVLPALSTLERLTMESDNNARAKMGFDLPPSDMGEDPFVVFNKFYRIYPHFSRVEL